MEFEFHKVWLSVGSNHPNADIFVSIAADKLQSVLKNWRMCKPYTTPAINGVDPDYVNAVACGEWAGDEESLVKLFKNIETQMGRSHSETHIVEIDIDLVCFDDRVLRPQDFSREYFSRGFRELKEGC